MYQFRIFPKGEYFHICNKSISNYHIFRNKNWINRFLTTINYCNNEERKISLSKALRKPLNLPNILDIFPYQIVHILAYCIMSDHYHLLVKILKEYSLSKYISNIENSYSKYYNKVNSRKGPLWQSRFRSTHITDNNTLLHVHRYIHLNPTTAGLVIKPEDWKWSSYNSYISDPQILSHTKEISITSMKIYKQFVDNQIDYQRTIKGIRRKLLE
ncbi:MAG: transposase [bacterium]|nr:transposase [bacterium]